MFTAYDLDGFGKRLSNDYIAKEASLTGGLAKLAQEKGLNRQEMNRVAESANTETYLSLIQDSEDKYLTFDLADAADAHIDVVGVEKTASHEGDYNSPIELPDRALWPETESMEKTAEAEIDTGAVTKEVHQLEGNLRFLEDAYFEARTNFEQNYTNLESMTKQAVLTGTPFSDTVAVLTAAAPAVAEPISGMFKETLSKRMPHIDFDKTAEINSPINTGSEYYNESSSLAYHIDRLGRLNDALNHFEKRYTEKRAEVKLPAMFKRANFVTKTIKDLFTLAWENKAATASVIALPQVYKAGKRRGRNEQGTLLQEALVKVGPDRRMKKVFR